MTSNSEDVTHMQCTGVCFGYDVKSFTAFLLISRQWRKEMQIKGQCSSYSQEGEGQLLTSDNCVVFFECAFSCLNIIIHKIRAS